MLIRNPVDCRLHKAKATDRKVTLNEDPLRRKILILL